MSTTPDTTRVLLLILDGMGYREEAHGNAVTSETMPRLFGQMARTGCAVLEASAEAVGLEAGQVGNSEAGHMTMGAGTIVPSMARGIDEAFHSGLWEAHTLWSEIRERGVLHIAGLISDAGVHGLKRSMIQAARLAARTGTLEIVVHAILDGVDALAGGAVAQLAELRAAVSDIPGARLGLVMGRLPFCDRSGNLTRTQVAVDALSGAHPLPEFCDDALAGHFVTEVSEKSFPPHLMPGGRTIAAGEPVLITSHRTDRARQVAKLLTEHHPVFMLADPGADVPTAGIFFPQEPVPRGLAHELRGRGIVSLRVAEKCKFPHVSFFFNGFDAGLEGEGVCIPSIPEDQIPENPAMSLAGVSEVILEGIRDPDRRVIVANLANLDQVGHLGRLDLATEAARLVDEVYVTIARACEAHGVTLLVTSDHGNADEVTGADGRPFGSHTPRPVPFFVQPAPGVHVAWRVQQGGLASVASSVLVALGIEPPAWMHPPLFTLERSQRPSA